MEPERLAQRRDNVGLDRFVELLHGEVALDAVAGRQLDQLRLGDFAEARYRTMATCMEDATGGRVGR